MFIKYVTAQQQYYYLLKEDSLRFSLPACSSVQEVVCSGAEGLRGHRETYQVLLSYRTEKHPRQVNL